MQRPKLRVKKFIAGPVLAVPLLLQFGGVALAQSAAQPAPTLPADQVVLNGTCVSMSQVIAAAQTALAAYAPGDQPAGVIVNGTWEPAALAHVGALATSQGCVGVAASTSGPVSSTNLPAGETDQIAVTGTCLSAAQVVAAAQDAVMLYAPGDQPAGVIVNGTWVPAAAANAVVTSTAANNTGCVVA
jgi:hypothetical protein